jgi:hypothetical protein
MARSLQTWSSNTLALGMRAVAKHKDNGSKEQDYMNIAYDVEFDLDRFLESMEDPERPAWRKIEDHMERRRLREELSETAGFED